MPSGICRERPAVFAENNTSLPLLGQLFYVGPQLARVLGTRCKVRQCTFRMIFGTPDPEPTNLLSEICLDMLVPEAAGFNICKSTLL